MAHGTHCNNDTAGDNFMKPCGPDDERIVGVHAGGLTTLDMSPPPVGHEKPKCVLLVLDAGTEGLGVSMTA